MTTAMPICKALWDGFVVHWTGTVYPCSLLCAESCSNSLSLGNLAEIPLAAMYQGAALRTLRRRYLAGNLGGLCCAHCTKGDLCGSHLDEARAPGGAGDPDELYPVTRLEVSLTDKCNMLCIMCPKVGRRENPPGLGRAGYIDPALFAGALRDFRDLSKGRGLVCLHWVGEPTLHPALPAILRSIDACGLGIALVTNGIRFLPALTDLIVGMPHAALVSFSINASTEGTYRTVNNSKQFARVLGNIEYLLARRSAAKRTKELAVSVTFVVLSENLGEAVPFRDYWFGRYRHHGAEPSLVFNGKGAASASQVDFLVEAGAFPRAKENFLEVQARLGARG
ncbi:MAG: SPASM domain-containing protein [Deltaproteobacteria bacterium]|nr:SPASM domain-containing protein [Deltaproteobacteria bacterium]